MPLLRRGAHLWQPAALTFGSQSQQLDCANCGNSFPLDAIQQVAEMDVENTTDDQMQWSFASHSDFDEAEVSHLRTYRCQNCGSEIVADETTAATECVYCGSPSILPGVLSGAYRPDAVIPFQKSKKEAMDALRNHCKGKKLLPNAFINENQIEMYPLVEFSPVLIMSRTSPLATMPLIRLQDLDAYSEIMQEEEAVPQISASAGKLADPSGEKKRRIFVYDRASQLQLLSEKQDTFLWAPSLPEKQLAAYRLVQRPCVDNRKKLRDTLIYRKEYDFTDLDKAFLQEVAASMALHRVGAVLGNLPVKQE